MGVSGNRLRWVSALVIIIALVIGVGLYMSGDNSPDGGGNQSEKAVELVSHEGRLEEGRPVGVTGVVRNTSSRELRRVKVSVSFYNAAGSQIGDTTARTGGLSPGDEWQFEVSAPQDSVSRYEIDRVTWR